LNRLELNWQAKLTVDFPLRAGRQGLTPAPSVKDAKWRGRHFADFLLEKIYAAPARCDEFRVRRLPNIAKWRPRHFAGAGPCPAAHRGGDFN
jgi:hypothetical protein